MNEDQRHISDQTQKIRALNDAFRRNLVGGTVLFTHGVVALGRERQGEILDAVRRFDAFTSDNDPYGEHDFGALQVAGEALFFKIDYYDKSHTAGSEDPTNPSVTCRVLTIMLTSEW